MTQPAKFEKPTTQQIGNDIFVYQPEEVPSVRGYEAPALVARPGMEGEEMPVRVQKLLTHLQELSQLEVTRHALEALDHYSEVPAPESLEAETLHVPEGLKAKQMLLQRVALKQEAERA